MNRLLAALRACFHEAAAVLRCPPGRLTRTYGLDDFLTNGIQEGDDAPTLAVKALHYFCADPEDEEEAFRVAVLAVAVFLNRYHANPRRQEIPQQAARDLVAILNDVGVNEQQIRVWVSSHFD